MSDTFIELLHKASMESLELEYSLLSSKETAGMGRSLSHEEVRLLAERIVSFPIEYRISLYAHYCFCFSSKETMQIFDIQEPEGKLRYIQNALSTVMGCAEGIIDDSLRQATEQALEMEQSYNGKLVRPHYSRSFRKKLKNIKVVQASSNITVLIAKQVAVFFLVCAIGFSTAIIANADIRRAVINWIIETFPEFSIFSMNSENRSETLSFSSDDIEIGYIPDGYVLKNQNESSARITYRFSSDETDITLVVAFSTGSPSYLDTEDAEIIETTLGGNAAYWWEHNSITYLVWNQNEVMCRISGGISIDEIFKIAKNIKITE